MKDYTLTLANLERFIADIKVELDSEPCLLVSTQNRSTGKWGMSKLWRAWMATTAEYMAANGCKMPLMINKDGVSHGSRPFNSEDAHLLFTSQWMLLDGSGERLSWAKNGHDGMRAANKGERFNALRKHELWAIDKGIMLINPKGSEYSQLEDEQNGQN